MPPALTPSSTPKAAAPDPYADHEAIKALVQRKITEWSKGRELFTRAAHRNILFYRGHQWIVWSTAQNRFRPAVLKRDTPRPVTNLFASTMDAFISVLGRIEPILKFPPATDEPADQATSDVADRVMDVIEDEVNIRVARQQMAVWNGLTGGVWLETGYDPDPAYGTRFLQHQQCLACQQTQAPDGGDVCRACGAGPMVPAQDGAGQPIGEDVPIGKLYVEPVPIFEMYFDPAITDWGKHRAYNRRRTVDLDLAKQRWPDLADQISVDAMNTSADFYGESLPTLGPAMDDPTQGRLGMMGGARQLPAARVTEDWYWQLPDATYPHGLLAVIVSRHLVGYAGPLPYSALEADGRRTPFLPHVFFPQKVVSGTLWPKSVADDLASKCAQHNRLEAMIEMIVMRSANPVWINPNSSGVTNFTGGPGQILNYNALGPAPAKPELIHGAPIPAGLMLFRQSLKQEVEELAGTFDVIKGSKPPNVSAGISLQILQERAQSRFGPMFILWETGWAEWARQALEIFRQFATEERLRRIKGRDGTWEVQKFIGADLQGRINVRPEAGSGLPRSTLAERAELEQLINLGVINPQQPEVNYEILKMYGKLRFAPGLADDTKAALIENEQFEALAEQPLLLAMQPAQLQLMAQLPYDAIWGQAMAAGIALPKLRPGIDDPLVHVREHRAWAKTETFRRLPLVVQLLAEKHNEAHQQVLAQLTPPPKVNVSLKGLLDSATSLQLAGGQAPSAPPGPDAAGTSPANGAGGPQGLAGHQRQMEEGIAASGG